MLDGPRIAAVAALIGDPARANMLTLLMDGRSLTARELAEGGGIAAPTASGHLARLLEAGLVVVRRQGRHRYFRLSGPDVAETLEALMGLAQRTSPAPVRSGPREPALRQARICYDHLAGERGVALLEALRARGIVEGEEAIVPTRSGTAWLAEFGVDVERLARGRRPLCRACLDWSERRVHLGGALGAALLDLMIERNWLKREQGRVLRFTSAGRRAFESAFRAPGC
ncbi:helix-turn-helix transcriptional regulator [Sphingosinicella sp. CPCC 101087]|uniref:ArsR/SmtB family transcription factor n=1 Tax=Sphingosinicella sp. CPCC 101087 TaxID=2497754 RepID=UPI00101D42CD|nr:winged helix-turn-helix domain-containing protein [Sphingosinicella sp. CPCC 101087]